MAKYNYPKYKILIDPDSKKVQGLKVGDVVRREYYDAPNLIYSLMVVLETGTGMVVGAESAWFVGALVEGDEPLAGQLLDFVRVTNLFDEERGGALYLTASDADSPYMDVIDGLAKESSLCLLDSAIFKDAAKIDIGKPVKSGQMLLLSMRVRANAPLEVPVRFGYADGSRLDLDTTVTVGTEWAYKLLAFTVDYPQQYRRTLSLALKPNQSIEIADLNIVPLADISNFSKAAKVRVGKITGVVDPVFGTLDGYGAYFQNLYATRNVNIAGTLTAGDENGFSSTFYVGKIHKNVILNSIDPEFLDPVPVMSDDPPPAGVGKAWSAGAATKIKVQSAGWRTEHVGQQYCFSIWMKSSRAATVSIYQDGHHVGDLAVDPGSGWRRYHISFRIRESSASPMVIHLDTAAEDMLLCSPQLESGTTPSQYQPTDGTLSYIEDYGAWFSKGGIGGTIQNPLLKLNEDGSICSRDGSFVINPDGTGHFASGRFRWNRDTITLQDFTLRWEDLSEDVRENLKGETGPVGRDGADGNDGARGPAGRDGADGAPGVAGRDGTDGRDGVDANLLDWVSEWDSGKTVIDGNSVITPKIFAGIRNAAGTITGVALGNYSLLTRNPSGQFQSEVISGIYGFRDGQRTFAIDTTGSVEIGRGAEYIRYNAATGKIEFGAAVAMQWAGATYIDADGIFTGTISAETISVVRLDASQITAGTIDTERLNVADLKAQLITADNIEALTLDVERGKIGGFSIDADSLYRGAKENTAGAFTSASDALTIGSNGIRGYMWRLDSSGTGALAGGNIAWDASGNVTFGSSVSASWESPISDITDALGGAAYPKLTHINSTGIYTGTLTAGQVNAVAIDAGSIETGTLSADRIAAGSITADKVDVANLQASIITTGYIEGLTLNFQKGRIGGWSIASDGITKSTTQIIPSAGITQSTGIAIRPTSSGSGKWNSGAYKPSGISITWSYRTYGGHIVMGEVAESSSSVKGKFRGIQMMDSDSREFFCLAAKIDTDGVLGPAVYNRIAGWAFDHQQISKGNVCLGSDGSIYNGTKWRLDNDGSGQVAGGNISWDASGTVTFSSAVSLNWTNGIDALATALGGATYPKLTYISSTGIYTGTLTADQINVTGIDASNITTGTLSADRIAAGSITADKLNVGDLQATLVTTSHIEGLTLNFTRGKIGGWTIATDNISSGNVGVSGVTAIQIRTASSGSSYWYSGSYKPAGVAVTWNYSSNGGHIVMGQVAASASSVRSGYYGIQMMDRNSREYFCLAAHTTTSSVTPYNRIAGWAFDDQQIYKGNVYLSSDGSIYNGTKWRLNNDGSGQIASGNISWNASGTVTFSAAVALNWSDADVSAIVSALGGSSYPKLTYISSTGIYTGSIRASQITIDSTLVVGGSSYNGSISVRNASNSVMATLDRTGITAVGGKIGGWNLTSSSIYAGSVYLDSTGNIYNGSWWKLASDGSGVLASSRITWTAAGVLTVRNAVIQEAVIKGTLRNPFVRADGSLSAILGGSSQAEATRPETEKYDNICIVAGSTSGGWSLDPPTLPWNTDQSGRRLTLTHYRYNSEYSYGSCTFTAPSGYSFFEYGQATSTLKMSRETIELMGYGTSTQFWGWIVLNRRDLVTTNRYGAYGQYLAMGEVTGSSSGASIRYKTYDGSRTMSVSRTTTGVYTISMPWTLGATSYMVMLTGRWGTKDNTPLYATVKSQSSTSFVVQTQDDTTANEGSFNFIIISTADFA